MQDRCKIAETGTRWLETGARQMRNMCETDARHVQDRCNRQRYFSSMCVTLRSSCTLSAHPQMQTKTTENTPELVSVPMAALLNLDTLRETR